jgi:D-alanine transaminase
MTEMASVNGKITPIDEACVSINDRGLIFGDGVYEVIVSYNGRLFLLEEHLRRLRRSLDLVRMDYVLVPPLADQINRVFAAAAIPRAKVYVQVTRGNAPRNHAFPAPRPTPNVIITVRPFTAIDPAFFADGVACITRPDLRWGRVDIKTVNLLPNCLAKQDAAERGCYEAIFVSDTGEVREATAANVFVVRGGTIRTHPETERILPGITRTAVVDLIRKAGLPLVEEAPSVEDLFAAEEVFLSGTTTEVMPVVRLDDRPVADAKPGPIARRLLTLFREWIKAQGY